MAFDYDSLISAVSGNVWEEKPVDIEEFVMGYDYLDLTQRGRIDIALGELQYEVIRASTQILRKETLIELWGAVEAERRWKWTFNEVIAQLGKGAGKDFLSTIACAYIVYLLLCMKDPAAYYGKGSGDAIDIINVAINAQQATNVFFNGFKTKIEKSPWFVGKYEPKAGHFAFSKNVNVYSGHSEREAFEGYNTLFVVLDEISGFAIESASGNEMAKTAGALYKMYRASVTSRFELGKIVLLSFPRFKNDFIQTRYNDVVEAKEVILKHHTFRINPELPPNTAGNEFTIEWEQDHIVAYKTPGVYALKRASWEVNPKRHPDMYMRDFYDDPVDSLGRFACMPSEAVDAFFKEGDKIRGAFVKQSALDENNRFEEWFKPNPDKLYFVHVDLAQKVDRCAVSMAHVESWSKRQIGNVIDSDPVPNVVVDLVRYWTPRSDKNVDFTEVREFILTLQRRGFNLKLVTFDRWNSADMMKELREYGIESEVLSVAKKHYTDMAMVVHESRLSGPAIDILVDELLALRITNKDKVDHTRSGSKDLADATCGAVYNAIAHTPIDYESEIDVKTYETYKEDKRIEEERQSLSVGPIKAPRKSTEPMPDDLESFLSSLRILGG